jgi:hypothetical protein
MATSSDLQHLRIFGCVAFVHVSKEKRIKLDAHSIKSIFVGYSDQTKDYHFYNPVSRTITINGDAKFVEHRFWHTPATSSTTLTVTLETLPDKSAIIEVIDPVFTPPIPHRLRHQAFPKPPLHRIN